MISIEAVESAIGELTRTALSAALNDWEIQVGFNSQVGDPRAELIRGPEKLTEVWSNRPHLKVRTRVEGAAEGDVTLYFSIESAWPLLRDVLCLPESAEPETLLDEGQLEAFGEMMNLLCGSSNTVYTQFGLRFSQSVDHLSVEQHETWEEDDIGGLSVVMPYLVDGCEPSEILQVMAFPLARKIAIAVQSTPTE